MIEQRTVTIQPEGLAGDLAIPDHAHGVVVFAHGSGSSRFSSRNRFVARALNERGLATLLLDLLTPAEEQVDLRTRHLRFDISLLAARLVRAKEWLRNDVQTRDWPIGYFGASTGAGAALLAAVHSPEGVAAIVSRGGRPDLAGDALERVTQPALLIVGGEDHAVIELNNTAFRRLHAEKQLEIVPGATHLFEEPGALEQVARLAGDWLERYLLAARAPERISRAADI